MRLKKYNDLLRCCLHRVDFELQLERKEQEEQKQRLTRCYIDSRRAARRGGARRPA